MMVVQKLVVISVLSLEEVSTHPSTLLNEVLLYGIGNLAQCIMPAWKGGEFGEGWIHVYVWPNPFNVQLKPSQCC